MGLTLKMNGRALSTKEALLADIESQFGSDTLRAVDLPNIPSQNFHITSVPSGIPCCITQRPIPAFLRNAPPELMVGFDRNIPRWKSGSVIKWVAWVAGYDSVEDANYAANQMAIATEKWNAANIGVTFQHVERAADANFALCHGGEAGQTLASAYFPNRNDLNFVQVYKAAFKPWWKGKLWRVFLHELGHVLGLRHELGLENDKGASSDSEKALSIMSYETEAPDVQPGDIAYAKDFYGLNEGAMIGKSAVIDYAPM